MGNIRTGTKLALYTSTFLIMYSILGFNTDFFVYIKTELKIPFSCEMAICEEMGQKLKDVHFMASGVQRKGI